MITDGKRQKIRSHKMTGQDTKVKARRRKKIVKTAAEKQLNLVDRLMDSVNRIHKRVSLKMQT